MARYFLHVLLMSVKKNKESYLYQSKEQEI